MLTMMRRTLLSPSKLFFKPHFEFGFRERLAENMKKRAEQQVRRREEMRDTAEVQEERKLEQSLTEEQKDIIKTYKVDKAWNLIIKESPDHNFQKDIIIHRKSFEKTTKQLRSAILFEDLLKTEIDILIYDTKGKPFAHAMLKVLYIFLTVGAAIWSIDALRKADPKNGVLLDRTTTGKVFKYSVYFCSVLLFMIHVFRYSGFRKQYVDKIVYNTQRQEFTFTKRNFLGFRYNYIASRFKILYTQNKFLNGQGVNYFDIDTKEPFSIVYKDSWIKQDLFSHLISQRIKL